MFHNKCDLIKARIRRDIINGTYQPGTILPIESEIRKRFSVSQGTINKAMSALAAEGFIRTKPKIGSVVLPVAERKITARLGIYVMRSTGHIFSDLNAATIDALQVNHYYPLLIDLNRIEGGRNQAWLAGRLEDALASNPELMVVDGQSGFDFAYLRKRRDDIERLFIINRCESEIDLPANRVLSDYRHGGLLAARHLLQRGCRRPCVALNLRAVLGDSINITAQQLDGFRRGLAEGGLDPDRVPMVAWDDPDRLGRLKELFTGPGAPDGMFAESDYTGYRFVRDLATIGVRQDDDIHLIGYFATPWSAESAAPFASISIDPWRMAALLGDLVASRRFEHSTILVEPVLRLPGAGR